LFTNEEEFLDDSEVFNPADHDCFLPLRPFLEFACFFHILRISFLSSAGIRATCLTNSTDRFTLSPLFFLDLKVNAVATRCTLQTPWLN